MKPVIGNLYRWRHQLEVLRYAGMTRDHDRCRGWHQFEKVDDPGKIWCEIRDEELDSMESVEDNGEVEEMNTTKTVSEVYNYSDIPATWVERRKSGGDTRTASSYGKLISKRRAREKARQRAKQKARRK